MVAKTWILSLIAIACGAGAAAQDAAAPVAAPSADYAGDVGVHALAPARELRLSGERGERDVLVRATFPADLQAPAPVIIFSHGVWGSSSQYQPLVRHWASHGYICLQPQHGDTIPEAQRGTGSAQGAFRGWRERAREITRLIDAIEAPPRAWGALGEQMNRERIAMAGHSFGAHIAQLLGGTRLRVDRRGRTVSLADARIDAIVMFAPRGRGPQLDEQAWADLEVPFMAVTGSNDIARLRRGEDVAWRMDAFLFAPASPRYLLFINGGYNNFGGLTQTAIRFEGWGEPDARHARYALDFTTAFWDAQLRDTASAERYLQQQAASRAYAASDGVMLLNDPADVPALLQAAPPHRVPRKAIRPTPP
ncbi:MAG: hypothetical protein AAF184_15725 [Pseudomonadota bacterium]